MLYEFVFGYRAEALFSCAGCNFMRKRTTFTTRQFTEWLTSTWNDTPSLPDRRTQCWCRCRPAVVWRWRRSHLDGESKKCPALMATILTWFQIFHIVIVFLLKFWFLEPPPFSFFFSSENISSFFVFFLPIILNGRCGNYLINGICCWLMCSTTMNRGLRANSGQWKKLKDILTGKNTPHVDPVGRRLFTSMYTWAH